MGFPKEIRHFDLCLHAIIFINSYAMHIKKGLIMQCCNTVQRVRYTSINKKKSKFLEENLTKNVKNICKHSENCGRNFKKKKRQFP